MSPSRPDPEKPASPAPSRGKTRGSRLLAIGLTVTAALVLALTVWKLLPHSGDSASASSRGEGPVQYWTCGMHPWVVLPAPGPCPICGMDLVKLDPAKFKGELTIDPVVVQNMGVRVGEVVTGPLVKTIRTIGIVDYDEENVRDINTKVSGWIEKLYVNSLGAEVKAGESLFSLYSPDLYTAQENYLIARRNERPGSNPNILQSARTRLDYNDVSPEQIDALEKRDEPKKALDIISPFSGVVVAKHANEGMRVEPGMQVYRIADLSRVWTIVTIYEYQLPYVEVGQEAEMSLPYIPGKTWTGKITYMYPYLDKQTREAKVRLEFDNKDGLLKPGMFASIRLQRTLAGEKTLVPRSAVISTGLRSVAFVSLGEGKFEPRNVETGVVTDDNRVEVLSGLKPGEKVVTSGQFLLDSEANTREALAKMIQGDSAAKQPAEVTASGASSLGTLPPALAARLTSMLDAYLIIQDKLAADTTTGIAEPAHAVAEALAALPDIPVPDDPHFWHRHENDLSISMEAANQLIGTTDLKQTRLAFGSLGPAVRSLLKATGIPPSFPRQVLAMHCPMYLQNQGGAFWLQTGDEVRNPFMGTSMLTCFDKREAMPVTGAANVGERTDSND